LKEVPNPMIIRTTDKTPAIDLSSGAQYLVELEAGTRLEVLAELTRTYHARVLGESRTLRVPRSACTEEPPADFSSFRSRK
jgi:hypothetical protein